MQLTLIKPDWSAPTRVKAVSTTRVSGVSQGCFRGLNVGDHVGDRTADVQTNRDLLQRHCGLAIQPFWMQQTHSVIVHDVTDASEPPVGDACITDQVERACAVMTADCLPVLLTNTSGSQVAAVHAGWRGLADGIIEATVQRFDCGASDILAWMGPCIGPNAFEIGLEVATELGGPEAAYRASVDDENKLFANLPLLAEDRLRKLGVKSISHANECTHSQPQRFYSYRRDGQTGRMATLIWLSPER